MTKKPQTLLLTTILLTILLISSAYAITVPSAHAQAVATSEAKGLTIINQVAGINLTIYHATPTLDVAGSYLGVLPTENIRYTLTGFGGTIEIQDTFTNGSLQIMDVLENTPSPLMNTLHTSSALRVNESYVLVEMAKAFLNNYKSYSANSLYGQLASTLNNANPTKNSTTTIGNINFNINTISGNSTVGNSTTFTWSYTFNGVNADCKCVSLTYENGYLQSFIDTWKLYPIGSTTVNLSEQQAENIAMQNAKTSSWTIGSGNQKQVITNFNLTKPVVELLEFAPAGNASNARSSDPLTLYPLWGIGVGLDKWYPGNAFGIGVDIWADTEKIRDMETEFSTLPPPAGAAVATIAESSIPTLNNQTSVSTVNNQASATAGFNMFPAWIMLAAFAAVLIVYFPVWLSGKKTLPHLLCLPKLRATAGVILCIMMGLTALVPLVNAGDTLIFGDNSSDTYNYHSGPEISAQQMIAQYITNLTNTNPLGNAMNAQGADTTPQDVQTCLSDTSQTPTATVYFDEGCDLPNSASQPDLPYQIPYWDPTYQNEWHYLVGGTYANGASTSERATGDVFDYQIASLTNENYFTWISACMSANTTTQTTGFYNGAYGPNPTPEGSGAPIGMPYAWTHELTTSTPTSNPCYGYMSSNGYLYPDSGAYCYIGFPWGSASLTQEGPEHAIDPNYSTITYGDFICGFFYYALVAQDSVDQALNYASLMIWNQPFVDSYLANGFYAYWPAPGPGESPSPCTLAVYGNGNMYLYNGPDYMTPPLIGCSDLGGLGVAVAASATDPCGYSLTYEYNYGDNTGWTTQTTHTYSSSGIYTVTVEAISSTGLTSQSSTTVTVGPTIAVVALDYDLAQWGNYCPLSANVWVDGNYAGTTTYAGDPLEILLAPGSHTFTFDNEIWDPYVAQEAYFYYTYDYNSGNSYNNGDSIPVTPNDVITAYYAW